jgi:IS30 family transposase
MKAILTVLHGHMVSSITYDNRFESAMHELVNDLLDCESYFCRPYHSWEKGWVDDYNRVVRQYFPKGYATVSNFGVMS